MNHRVQEILDRQQTMLRQRVSRMFAVLMMVQWMAAIAAAVWITPLTWIGDTSHLHMHVWMALLLGGLLAAFPIALAILRPGALSTRHVIAISQMLFSSLLIHLMGGRIETHFHIFGSLAFIAFYRDWRVVVSATAVVIVDHWIRGVYLPLTVFGDASASNWRWLEHAGWVVFEDIILLSWCREGLRDMRAIALDKAALEVSRSAVEQEVHVRMAELSATADELSARELDLREAKRLAEAANRAKSDFLANMSHEIRTPMTAILGYADLLVDSAQTPTERGECVQIIRRNGTHLLTLINDILDISKIEAGGMTFEMTPCNPLALVESVFSLMNVRAKEKSIQLRIERMGDIPNVMTDRMRLRQVLVNLVGNAIKFTAVGQVTIRLSAEPGVSPGRSTIRIEVMDTGIGMSPDEVKRLFKPFSQADTSTTRRYGGTGVGLVISQRLVTALGGTLTVTSESGRGTIMTVSLDMPLSMIAAEDEAGSSETTEAAALPEIPGLRAERILLAEDGVDNQRLIGLHLRKAGAEVTIVENGRLAVEAVLQSVSEGKPFGLVLMDMQMPELDGYGATAALRRQGWSGPIVALTAHAMNGDRERCMQAGCDDYLTKPASKADLLRTCARWLGAPPERAAA